MLKRSVFAAIALGLLVLCLSAWAQDKKEGSSQGMGPMGPPEEMKQLAFLVGTWDFTMKFKMDPNDTNWMESSGTATYAYAVGGATMMATYQQPMMGMQFSGGSMQCYDRETKKWQMTWVDNMAARLSLYTGTVASDGSVFQGEDMMQGQTYLNRMTMSNQTPTSFDWKGEMSMDGGKTWMVWATAKYTKKK